ncbi:MAG: ABC transporter ATP-binding protein [Candidatus Heimdallarchaeota archaeon]
MSQSALRVSNLTKFYGNFKALDSVSFSVEAGWIYGYLGPNGAGKTTTIRTMLGLLRPDEGEVQITGVNPYKNPVQTLQIVGYAPELPNLQTFFNGEQLLDFTGKIFGLSHKVRRDRVKQLLQLVGLKDVKKKIGKYSKGMVQRLSIAQSLINNPTILIMDEPTIGMDPEATAHFRDLITNFPKEGKTVFISSHLLGEVQRICTHVGVIDKGKIIVDGPISRVLEAFTQQWVVEAELKQVTPEIITHLQQLSYVQNVQTLGNKLLIELNEKKDFRGEISSEIVKHKGVLLSLNLHRITLEEAYLRALRGG